MTARLRRVPVYQLGPGVRLVLELEVHSMHPVRQALISHLDAVRELLVSERISPDEAHGMLCDVTGWWPYG